MHKPLLLSAALLVAACSGAPSDVPITIENTYHDQIKLLPELQRRGLLRQALLDNDLNCTAAVAANASGGWRGQMIWAVRCKPEGEYAVFIAPDGTAQARKCADLAASALPPCRFADPSVR
jgi:hypothetical protein